MSDFTTKQHNLEVIRNKRREAINHLNEAIVDVIYISMHDEIEGTAIMKQADDLWYDIANLKNRLKSIEI